MSFFTPFAFIQQEIPTVVANIVQNGLLSWLDQGNSSSYTSGSSDWLDLSGNNNSASLFNSPTFNTGGYFAYDGTDDYARIKANFYIQSATKPSTVSVWFRTNASGALFIQQGATDTDPSSAGGWIPWMYIDTNGKIRYSMGWTVLFSAQTRVSPSSYNDGNWYNATAVYDGNGTQSLYVNGTLVDSGSCQGGGFDSGYQYFIGSGQTAFWPDAPGGYSFNGDIGPFNFYSKSLSGTDVDNNFDVLKSRYGY